MAARLENRGQRRMLASLEPRRLILWLYLGILALKRDAARINGKK